MLDLNNKLASKVWHFLLCATISFSLIILNSYKVQAVNHNTVIYSEFNLNQYISDFYFSVPVELKDNSNISLYNTAKHKTIIDGKNIATKLYLSEKAKQAYRSKNYQKAIKLWKILIKDRNSNKAIIHNYIALAYYQLGYLQKAQLEIKQSRELIENDKKKDKDRTLAQILNNQGIIELATGNTEQAIACWDLAIATYQQLGDNTGAIQARLNRAKSFKSIGLYQRSLNHFTDLYRDLAAFPDSPLKLSGLRDYGNILRLVGEIEKSQLVLKESLAISDRLFLPQEQIKTLLSLGKTLSIKANTINISVNDKALEYYQKGIDICNNNDNCLKSDLYLKLNLAKFNLLVKTESWKKEINLIDTIDRQFKNLKPDLNYLNLKLNYARTLIDLKNQLQQATKQKIELYNIPDWQQIITLSNSIIAEAEKLNYRKAQSYGCLLIGHIHEILSQWDKAKIATIKALEIARSINAVEANYLSEWQLGRIERAEENREAAIAHYRQGITILNSLSNEIASVDNSIKNHFRNTIEPIYREKIALLLDTSSEKTISQKNLMRARNTIESLQIAELNNFFREACLKEKSVSIDSVDKDAAAVYPIILPDRLEIILSIRDRPLQHYSVAVSQTELEATVTQLRQTVVIRSRRTYYQPAQQLYSWLIAPVAKQLAENNIKTIVLIPDGALRNVPLSVLHDGNNFLIEQYNLVFNPGLQLLNPRPLKDTSLKTLAAGLTEEKDDFAALNYVARELAEIQDRVKSTVLLNEEFTTKALQDKITYTDYPIVHIATHGQFSSSLDKTFLLAWNDRINLDRLQQILQTRATDDKAIELLILSACETATGDDKAALGLAGMAIRAGARSTIATLWSINDRSTAELMGILYQKLTDESIGKAEAIRQAQLSLLNDSQYEHPFYWAAYTIIGNWL